MDLARFIADRFNRSLNKPCRLRTAEGGKPPSAEIGALGESLAARWLQREGRRILWRNYRARTGGEADLVCRDRATLVFVEVKTRTSTAFGHPSEAVDDAKEALLLRAAHDWIRRLGDQEVRYRFDIVEVTLIEGELPAFRCIENAFFQTGEGPFPES